MHRENGGDVESFETGIVTVAKAGGARASR